jgi:predicted MFS family arabinose efflux permease
MSLIPIYNTYQLFNSGNEIGPFRAIEESTLVHLSPPADRTSILAWYTVFGFTGASVGILSFGWIVRVLQDRLHWSAIASYRTVFWAYAGFGLIKLLLCFMLSNACEREEPDKTSDNTGEESFDDETRPLLTNGYDERPKTPEAISETRNSPWLRSLLPTLSPESASVVLKLCLLFGLDSFASGLTPQSWQVYFFNKKFGLSEGKLGSIFFITSVLSAISNIAAAPIARRIGLIKTMVLTHVPASVALALIPVPSTTVLAILLLFFRACTNSMDQAPRQAFLAAAVLPVERTAVMGAVNVVKTLSQSVGPAVTGIFAERSLFWMAFVIAGVLKLLYDVLILAMFLGHRTREDCAEEERLASESQSHDEREEIRPTAP